MPASSIGERYPLLLYQHLVTCYRLPALLLAVFLLGVAALLNENIVTMPQEDAFGWLLAGGTVSLAVWILTRIAPALAYAQPREDHLRIQTPIYRLKISYRRIHGTRPVEVGKVFFQGKLRQRETRALRSFFGDTALMVDLIGWPLPPLAMRFFLHRYMLSPDQPGLVLITKDWMALSKQLSSLIDLYQIKRRPKARGAGTGASDLLQDLEDDWN
ncbi:MAG: hypothetical protein JXA97_03100 [Anaerolineales bacterium]|nr:hypothetical protein [Anaerolineales bacterium]